MNYRNLGSSGLSVSEVALGSWLTFGSSVDREATRELVEKAYDLGINLFDTADVYSKGDGHRDAAHGWQGAGVVLRPSASSPTRVARDWRPTDGSSRACSRVRDQRPSMEL